MPRQESTCTIEGCDKPVKARGWCIKHYTRWKRYRDPLRGRLTRPAHERVLAMCTREDRGYVTPCLVFTGSKAGRGYGIVGIGSSADGTQHFAYVHRVMWEYQNGAIPAGLVIDHLCRQLACCEPSHLEPVTTRENLRRGEGPAVTRARHAAKRAQHGTATPSQGGASVLF